MAQPGPFSFLPRKREGGENAKGKRPSGERCPGPTAPFVPPGPFRAFAPFAFSRQNAGQAFAARKLNGPDGPARCGGQTGLPKKRERARGTPKGWSGLLGKTEWGWLCV